MNTAVLVSSPRVATRKPMTVAMLLATIVVGLGTAFPGYALDLVAFTGITGPLKMCIRDRNWGSRMFTATSATRQHHLSPPSEKGKAHNVIETRLWLEEHDWLYRLLRSEDNVSPTFRFPDLISASVSLVFTHQDAPCRIFRFLGTELVLRPPETPRRRESMWRHQYQLSLIHI